MRGALIRLLFISVAVAFFGVMIVFPLVAGPAARAGWIPHQWQSWLPLVERLQTLSMQAFVVTWFFFLGSCFASFLNVVAWRVPRGRGINGSSHCPYCGVRLSMADNIPIVGWLKNGGRCRDCRHPISPRYLVVEIVLGFVTLLIIGLEVFWSGINLPGVAIRPFAILDSFILAPQARLIWTAALHLTLVYTLFTFTVIRSERLSIPAAIAITAAVLAVPMLTLSPAGTLVPWSNSGTRQSAAAAAWFGGQPMTLLLGALFGSAMGLGVAKLPWFSSAGYVEPAEIDIVPTPASDPAQLETECFENLDTITDADLTTVRVFNQDPTHSLDELGVENGVIADNENEQQANPDCMKVPAPHVIPIHEGVACYGLVGLILGWQAVAGMAAIQLLLVAPLRSIIGVHNRWLGPISGQVFLATLVLIAAWRWVMHLPIWPEF